MIKALITPVINEYENSGSPSEFNIEINENNPTWETKDESNPQLKSAVDDKDD